MGIRGLTTFINNRSHLYLKDHELHDCNVVIDGNSLASNLYKWHCKSNDCFGGDYDKFSHVIRNFFELLSQCNITPYVILDGGYEKRKLNTVITRMKNKIRAAQALNAVTEGSESVFPLFLREVFVDIVIDLGLKVARCDFEGDMEIAGIAQTLECPVISYDSDFYIFGSLYIPFSTVDLNVRKGRDKSTKNSYMYLPCKIFHIEEFLLAFGGLDRNNLPLLAVLLGNDYIKGSLFGPFYRNLKIQKCSGNQSDQQKRIKSVIVWLQNETIESAIKTVLSRFKGARRRLVLRKIRGAMKGYFQVNSELLKYLDIEPINVPTDLPLDFSQLDTHDDDDVCATDINNSDSDGESSESENECSKSQANSSENESDLEDGIVMELDNEPEESINRLSTIFQRKYRSCQYPACFMDMITLNRYYCIPQVEDSSLEPSHTISFDILKIMYKILISNAAKGLTIVCRRGKGGIRFYTLPKTEINVPSLEDIEKLTLENRKLLLLDLLSIDNKFSEILTSLPVHWHLFLISLIYAINRGSFDEALICSSFICFIILNYIDPKVGFCRVSKTFDKKFAQSLLQIKSQGLNQVFESFDALPYEACLLFMDKMIPYFQMESKLKTNYRLYDKILVHSLSQIQSVYLHVKYLNSLLDNPFPSLEIHKIFDGTFLYNMTTNLRKRINISEYIDFFLKDCPCVSAGLKQILCNLSPYLDAAHTVIQPVRRRKKKKKQAENNNEDVEKTMVDDEEEAILDPNNPYSILAVL